MKSSLLSRVVQTLLCLLVLAVAIQACKQPNPLDIPVPASNVKISIDRLDQKVFDLTALSFRNMHPTWQNQYGDIYIRYIEDILAIGQAEDTNLFASLRYFITDSVMVAVQDRIQQTYPDLSPYEQQLTDAWSYYSFYFPQQTIPVHLSFLGGFHTPVAMTEEGIGIGLEMFLGTDCEYYDLLQLPVYLQARMTPELLVPTIMKGWVESEFPLETVSPTLLESIIHQGKVLYILDAILPNYPEHQRIFYSEEQLNWAKSHERLVWAHFIDNELLFTKDLREVGKYTNDGPFTVDLVKESPPRMGHYIGWQIVRAYMAKQKAIDLVALMDTNSEIILNQSKYKP